MIQRVLQKGGEDGRLVARTEGTERQIGLETYASTTAVNLNRTPLQNYANLFNPETVIRYEMGSAGVAEGEKDEDAKRKINKAASRALRVKKDSGGGQNTVDETQVESSSSDTVAS